MNSVAHSRAGWRTQAASGAAASRGARAYANADARSALSCKFRGVCLPVTADCAAHRGCDPAGDTRPQNRIVLDASRLLNSTMKRDGRLSGFNSVIDRRLLIKPIEQPNLSSLFTRNGFRSQEKCARLMDECSISGTALRIVSASTEVAVAGIAQCRSATSAHSQLSAPPD